MTTKLTTLAAISALVLTAVSLCTSAQAEGSAVVKSPAWLASPSFAQVSDPAWPTLAVSTEAQFGNAGKGYSFHALAVSAPETLAQRLVGSGNTFGQFSESSGAAFHVPALELLAPDTAPLSRASRK